MDSDLKNVAADRIRRTGIVIAMFFATIATLANRDRLTHDGMSYLDMSQAVLRGDWGNAVNGLWSPLYPWLLALGRLVVRPSPQWEFPTVHAVNLAIFLASLLCFDFFLRQLLLYRRAQPLRGEYPPVPAWVVVAVGYTLFIWSSFTLIGMTFVTPDFAVAACAYLAAGWLLRCRLNFSRSLPFVFLGFALGLGYLAKAPMFPLGLVFLALAALPTPPGVPTTRLLLRVGVAVGAFSVVAGILVLAFFLTKGRWTLGDSSWLNYAFQVNRLPNLHYQGEQPGFGVPVHPTRKVSTMPEAYEFATPIVATYAPWFDPAYWYEGVRPRFDLRGHLIAVRWSLRIYRPEGLLYHWWPSVAVLAVVIAFLVRRGWIDRNGLRPYESLCILGIAALAMFALIHLEARFVAAFMTFLWLGIASGVRLSVRAGRRSASLVLAAVLLAHAVPLLIVVGQQMYGLGREVLGHDTLPPRHIDWRVADGLRRMGVGPGDRVGVIGPGIRAYWAWLARTPIVAEVPPWAVRDFWTADEHVRRRILERFAEAGAKVVVNQPNAPLGSGDYTIDLGVLGWARIEDTEYYAFVLKK